MRIFFRRFFYPVFACNFCRKIFCLYFMRLSGAIIYTWEVFYMLNILFALDDSEKSERLIKFFKESKDIDFGDVCHDGTSASYNSAKTSIKPSLSICYCPATTAFICSINMQNRSERRNLSLSAGSTAKNLSIKHSVSERLISW